MSDFVASKSTALEWGLTEFFSVNPTTAKKISFVVHILVVLLLILAIVLFAEWRFIVFEELGCEAFCRCIPTYEYYAGV